MTPKLCSRVCRLTAVRLRTSRLDENPLEFREGPGRRHGKRLSHLREIVHGKDSALPVRQFADVVSRPALFQGREESSRETLLHRGQKTTPAFGDEDGGAIHGQRAHQTFERGLHVRHQIVGEKQASRHRRPESTEPAYFPAPRCAGFQTAPSPWRCPAASAAPDQTTGWRCRNFRQVESAVGPRPSARPTSASDPASTWKASDPRLWPLT